VLGQCGVPGSRRAQFRCDRRKSIIVSIYSQFPNQPQRHRGTEIKLSGCLHTFIHPFLPPCLCASVANFWF